MSYFTLTKISCHNWRISNDTGYPATAILYDYLNNVVSEGLIFTNDLLDIELDEDGAYYVEIIYEVGEARFKFYCCIYDFCMAESCFKSLFKYVLCKCADPCDDDCAELYELDKKRTDLEFIFALYTTIERSVYYEKYKYLNIYSLNTSRRTLMGQIGRAITKMNIVVTRCGMCTDETVEDLTC